MRRGRGSSSSRRLLNLLLQGAVEGTGEQGLVERAEGDPYVEEHEHGEQLRQQEDQVRLAPRVHCDLQ